MKARKFLIAALALSMATVACSQNNTKLPDGTSAKDLLPSKAQVDSVSYLLGVNFGTYLKSFNFGEDLNYSLMKEGMVDFLKAEGDNSDPEFLSQFKIDPNEMNDLFNRFIEKRSEYTAAVNAAKEKKFFDDNAKKPGIETTESGLQYKIIEPGNPDAKPTNVLDTVLVRYKGTLVDGTVFDEVPEDAEPISLTLSRVIPGWQEGLQLIGEGGKVQLFIPSELGYGSYGSGMIEPNATLIFDVELVSVSPYVAPEGE